MKRTDSQALWLLKWPGAHWLVLLLLLSVVTAPLGRAQEQPSAPATITVESKTVAPATKTTIAVTVDNAPNPGIASIQGQFGYDPRVLTVTDLTFPQVTGGSSVTVFNAQEPGRIRFAATLAGADLKGIRSDTLLEFAVEAVGKDGDKSNLTLTIEVLSDVGLNSVPYQIINGVFQIKAAVNQLPVVDFEFSPAQPTAGQTVQFTDKSTDPDGQLKSWKWEFGDGGTSDQKSPSYVYKTAGTYTVKLVVTDDKGGQSQLEKKITIGVPGMTEVTVTNYPNPASERTKFVYGWILPTPARQASLKIFNMKGELVFSKDLDVQKTEFSYDLKDNAGRPLPNGPYFYFVTVITQDNRSFRSSVSVLSVQR